MFVFIFVFFGLFSTCLLTMPTDFTVLGVTAEVQDKDAVAFFGANNVTTYNYTLSVDISYPGSKIYEGVEFGLPSNQAIEFWWGSEAIYYDVVYVEVRHLTKSWWWWDTHRLSVTPTYVSLLPEASNPDVGLRRWDVVDYLYNEDANASYCEFECSHMNVKLFIAPSNESWSMSQSWDNGTLILYTSYNIDWTETSTNMWHILMQLLTFQNPELGVPGIFGTIISWIISGTLWACIAIIVYAVITAVIPLIPGYKGGG